MCVLGLASLLPINYVLQVQKKDEDDEHVARAIADKMGDTPGVSYSDIASKALEVGRPDLAIRVHILSSTMLRTSMFYPLL